MKKIIGLITGIFGVLITAISAVFLIILAIAIHKISETESIGIIGGADGPTAVFLASSGIAVPPLMAVIGLIIGIICIICSAVLLHKQKVQNIEKDK
ncbi:MAG: hypothetical protein K2I82_02525 [Ruminococcus sp.]|nr:hypothetical protein [Ruminococcus sp.]